MCRENFLLSSKSNFKNGICKKNKNKIKIKIKSAKLCHILLKNVLVKGAMKQGWGACGTFKVINLQVLRAGMVYMYLSYGYGLGYGLNRP